jgi:hypothetical protein
MSDIAFKKVGAEAAFSFAVEPGSDVAQEGTCMQQVGFRQGPCLSVLFVMTQQMLQLQSFHRHDNSRATSRHIRLTSPGLDMAPASHPTAAYGRWGFLMQPVSRQLLVLQLSKRVPTEAGELPFPTAVHLS